MPRSELSFLLALVPAAFLLGAVPAAAQTPAPASDTASVRVEIITDEAGAALDILAARRAGREISEAQWTRIRSRVYLTIKPRSNSFVFETNTNPAIFLFVDPARTRAQLENTVAHELHHIGYSGACAGGRDSSAAPAMRRALEWMGAFGEGLAMLAAAGGPDIHPHAVSPPADRARWDADIAGVADGFRQLDRFFLDVLTGRMAQPDSIQQTAMSFFGVQGPWYTVGWTMARTIELADGRAALVRVICRPAALVRAYGPAADRVAGGSTLPRWSDALLKALQAAP